MKTSKYLKALKVLKFPVKVELITETMPDLLKKDRETGVECPYPAVVKTSRQKVYVGDDYGRVMNRARVKQGLPADFVPGPLPWGHYVPGSRILIEHNGRTYLRVYFNKQEKSEVTYRDANGNRITYEVVKNYLPVPKDTPVATYALDSVLDIRPIGFPGLLFRLLALVA